MINPKLEIRNTKQNGDGDIARQGVRGRRLEFVVFRFWDLFRISDFEFRIYHDSTPQNHRIENFLVSCFA